MTCSSAISFLSIGGGGGGDERAKLALRWISGDELERDEAAKLGMRRMESEETVALPGNPAIESVLIAIADLAGLAGKPLVLCFDQVDNLTNEQMLALTQFLHPLLDHARNLLVLLSGVQRKILDYVEQGVILPAAWERIAQNAQGIQLSRITRREAHQLAQARLERFFEPWRSRPELQERRAADALFPLGRSWFEERLADAPEVRPRNVVNWARDRWREQQAEIRTRGGEAWFRRWPESSAGTDSPPPALAQSPEDLADRIDEEVQGKITEQIARRELEPDTLPADAANLCGLVEALLRQCQQTGAYGIRRIERPSRAAGPPPGVSFRIARQVADEAIETGVAFLATGNRSSMSRSLGRIAEDQQRPARVVVVFDERLPLRVAPRARGIGERSSREAQSAILS